MKISELMLHTRASNCLIRVMGLQTTEELEKYSPAELLNSYGMGKVTLASLIEALDRVGVKLRQDSPAVLARSSLEAENWERSLQRAYAILEKYKEGYTHAEVAEMYNLTPSSIQQICQKAFRHQLSKDGIDPHSEKSAEIWGCIVRQSYDARKARKT